MLMNYFKTAVRNLRRNPGFTFINISGLALGLSCCLLILLWVHDEWSFDRFHVNRERIYRVVNRSPGEESPIECAVSPLPMAPALKAESPDISAATRYSQTGLWIQKDGESVYESGCLADPDFLAMFSFPLILGDPGSALSDPLSIVLTRSMAERFFSGEDPMGQILTTRQGIDLRVTGLLEDVPPQSHMSFDFILPFEILGRNGRRLDSWDDVSWYSYVLLREGADAERVAAQVDACNRKYKPQDSDRYGLQLLTRIHLFSHYKFDFAGRGDIRSVLIFTLAALLVLVIACFNFINLTTARAAARAREVGIRKTAGARRLDIIGQFFLESLFLTLLALLISLGLAKLFLPAFNGLSGKQLSLGVSGGPEVWGGLIGLTLLAGILSGTWPAWFLSSFQPAGMVKRRRIRGGAGTRLRKILVVGQFTLSIFLLIGTLGISRQVEFMKSTDLGFEKDHVIFFQIAGDMRERSETAKTELRRFPGVLSATALHSLPIYESSGTSGATWEGKPDVLQLQMRVQSADPDFLRTLGIEMAEGRFFSRENPSDLGAAYVLNQTAVRAMGLTEPIGKRFDLGWTGQREGPIIGVVRDYQLRSMRDTIEPLVIIWNPAWFSYICLKIDSSGIPATLAQIEGAWKTHNPERPFSFEFLDDAVGRLYRSEERMGAVFRAFTLLAVFISCLGIFGLASYMADQRVKEIGIRKVLGSSTSRICLMLSMDFARCVAVANLIAWPAAGYALSRWMAGFAGRAGLNAWIFLFSGGLALAVSLVSVGWQSIRAASADPVRALRRE